MIKKAIEYINTRIGELDELLKTDKISISLHRVLVAELSGVSWLLHQEKEIGK